MSAATAVAFNALTAALDGGQFLPLSHRLAIAEAITQALDREGMLVPPDPRPESMGEAPTP